MHQEENIVSKLTNDLLQRSNGELYAFDVVTSCNLWTFVSTMVRNVEPIDGPIIYIHHFYVAHVFFVTWCLQTR